MAIWCGHRYYVHWWERTRDCEPCRAAEDERYAKQAQQMDDHLAELRGDWTDVAPPASPGADSAA